MDSNTLFCRRDSILYSQQYLSSNAQEYGYAQWDACPLYGYVIFSVGNQTFVEPICRYHKVQTMVDSLDADSDVCCDDPPTVHASA